MVSGGRALVLTFWEVKTSIILYSSCGLNIITIDATVPTTPMATMKKARQQLNSCSK